MPSLLQLQPNSCCFSFTSNTISYRSALNAIAATIFAEHVPCGDETTVQSHLIQNVNQQLNAVCKSTSVDMVVTDYKSCINRPVSGIPDIVVLNPCSHP